MGHKPSYLFVSKYNNPPSNFNTMIRKALGFGLMILILKFLMREVFVAGQNSLVTLFSTANVLMSNIGNIHHGVDVTRLIPQ